MVDNRGVHKNIKKKHQKLICIHLSQFVINIYDYEIIKLKFWIDKYELISSNSKKIETTTKSALISASLPWSLNNL